MVPSPAASSDWRSTIQAIAVDCTQVPVTDSTWPTKKSRKFRVRSARNAPARPATSGVLTIDPLDPS